MGREIPDFVGSSSAFQGRKQTRSGTAQITAVTLAWGGPCCRTPPACGGLRGACRWLCMASARLPLALAAQPLLCVSPRWWRPSLCCPSCTASWSTAAPPPTLPSATPSPTQSARRCWRSWTAALRSASTCLPAGAHRGRPLCPPGGGGCGPACRAAAARAGGGVPLLSRYLCGARPSRQGPPACASREGWGLAAGLAA